MQMDKGLEAHGQSTLMSLPTMIDVLPTGCGLRVQHWPADRDIKIASDLFDISAGLLMHICASTRNESGVFYALDMGGTNFRVVTINLAKRKNRVVSVRRRFGDAPAKFFGCMLPDAQAAVAAWILVLCCEALECWNDGHAGRRRYEVVSHYRYYEEVACG